MKGYEDSAYWYTEIPNVSILNAAAWRCGRIALQEFKTEKKVRGEEPWVGRKDLWICTDSDDKEEFIEAKHEFVPLSGAKEKNGLPTKIKKSMDKARSAARAAKALQPGVTALAVVFASVSAAPKTCTKKIDQQIIKFCEGIKSSIGFSAFPITITTILKTDDPPTKLDQSGSDISFRTLIEDIGQEERPREILIEAFVSFNSYLDAMSTP